MTEFYDQRDVGDIGTQSLALASRRYQVTASDLSPGAIARLQREASMRGLSIASRVDDMRTLATWADASADAVIAGICIVSVRDYAALPPTRLRFNPHGVRELGADRDADAIDGGGGIRRRHAHGRRALPTGVVGYTRG